MKMMNLCAAALCVLAVAACADRMNKSSNTAGSGSGYSSSSGSSTGSGYSGGSSTGSGGSTGMAGTSGSTSSTSSSQTSYGVVQAIDQLQRQDVGVGVMGAAAAGGMPSDKVYRVTVRLDDGSTQMVVLESSPSYKIGDRIRYSNGSVQAY